MRIVQFLHGNQIGGMEKFCLDLSNALAMEHEVMLIADPVFRSYCSDRVLFEPLDVEKSRNNPLFLFDLYRKIKAFHADIIHVHKQNSIRIINRLSRFLKVPYVATKHDMQTKKAFYGLEYAISISDEVTETIKAKKVFKIYNGIPYRTPRKILLSSSFNIVAVGGLRPVKGFDRLIETVSVLPFEYHLTIVGEGDERSKLETLIKERGLQEKVTLVGFHDNVQDYLYSADLQIISSYSEGFSLAMIEGVMYAPVLVSTPVSGCTEVLDGVFLYDMEKMKEKIEDVYHRYETYVSDFNRLKQQYQEIFTIGTCAKKHEAVYLDIIKDWHEK